MGPCQVDQIRNFFLPFVRKDQGLFWGLPGHASWQSPIPKRRQYFMDKPTSTSAQVRLRLERSLRAFAGIVIGVFLLWRVYHVLILQQDFGADTWVRFALSGLILGGMYALIAIGYTLVYGIMFMINFAHGEVMMLGAFGGFFTFEALRFLPAPTAASPDLNFLNAHPYLSVLLAFLVGITVSATAGYFLEKIAYRPLRRYRV